MPTHRPSWGKVWPDWLLIAAFVAVIGAPFAEMYLRLEPALPNTENRRWSSAPKFKRLAHFAPFLFELVHDYVPDHFGFRRTLVRWHALLMTQALGVSGTSRVLLGRQGWLFYAGDRALDDYLFVDPFTEAELKNWAETLEWQRQWCARHGIHFLFMVAPNSQTIYPEYLPARIKKTRPGSRLDQLAGYLSRHTQIEMVDVRSALRARKLAGLLYCRTDSHWNDEGAFVAYQAIVKRVQLWFPFVTPLMREQFLLVTNQSFECDLARMSGLPDRWGDGRPTLIPIPPFCLHHQLLRDEIPLASGTSIQDTNLPKAVVFHDSFGHYLRPFLSEHFRRAVYLTPKGIPLMDPETVTKEHPDVVILEVAERLLMQPNPRPLQAMHLAEPNRLGTKR